MSPELIPRSKEPSSGSGSTQYDATMVDAWALGVTLYLLTTGRYPFEDQLQKQSQACSVLNIIKGNIQPFPAHVSDGTRALVRQLLKTDPAQRTKLSSFLSDPYVLSKALEYAREVDREDLILGAPSPQEAAVISTPPKSSPPAAGFLTRLFAIGKKS
jgi:serine/threonine protein kinase